MDAKYNSLVTQYRQQSEYIEVYIKTKQVEIDTLCQESNLKQIENNVLKEESNARQRIIDALKEETSAKQRIIDTLKEETHAKQLEIDTLKKEFNLNSFKKRDKPTSPRYIKMRI
jgi:hypothetical protein